MLRLLDRQRVSVELELDDRAHHIDCAVGNVSTPIVTLAPIGELAAELQVGLICGAPGFIVFEWNGTPVALRGGARAIYGGAALEFVVFDGVHMQERRAAPRAPVQIPVRATLTGARGPNAFCVETATVDLSICGALLERCPGLGPGPWQIELHLPDDPAPVSVSAVLARCTHDHVAVTFAALRDVDVLRLAGTIADAEQLKWP